MKTRERFRNALLGRPVDRMPMIEWAPYWDQTLARWHSEGLAVSLTAYPDIQDYFGLDRLVQFFLFSYGPDCPRPAFHGAPIITDMDNYHQILPALYPGQPFNQEDLAANAALQQDDKTLIWLTFEGFFWHPRVLFGIEEHLLAFFDQPSLMHEMNQRVLEYNLRSLDSFCAVCQPDFVTLAEDMSYNHGPMVSKQLFDEFMAPYYRQLVGELKKRDIPVIVDSDGDIMPLIPWLTEVGVDGLLPLERMAGNDVAAIRRQYPDFRMIGAFDKTIMHLGEEALREEFERLAPVVRQGGFIPSVDHQTPPEVSMEDYRLYISLLQEYAQANTPQGTDKVTG